jgi:hypothetical protein
LEIATSLKVLETALFGGKMANFPNPDYNPTFMEENFGTVCLITNPIADKYLKKSKKNDNIPPKDRLSRPCGGRGGFDDYAEWLT